MIFICVFYDEKKTVLKKQNRWQKKFIIVDICTMAIIITDECINCGACEPECPNNAIYEASAEWAVKDGTNVEGKYTLEDGSIVDVAERQVPISDEVYYIVPEKCTECMGFHEEPQCAAVCPVDCCVPDPDRPETEEVLLERKASLHI